MSLDRFFFTLLLLLLPTQLAKHFFPDFSLVMGSRVDYLSPTIYFTEILLFLTVIFWMTSRGKPLLIKAFRLFSKQKMYFFLTGVVLFISIVVADNKLIALFKLVKIIELIFLFLYISFEKVSLKKVFIYCIFTASYSALIAFGQFIKQGSIGGVFWFLGERNFSIYTPGLAKAAIFGKLYVRPYATLPHPNVLGGFIVLFLPTIVYYIVKSKNKFIQLISTSILVILLSSIFLTMSRAAIVMSFLSIGATLLIFKKEIGLKLFIIIFLPYLLFGYLIWGRFYNLFSGNEDTLYQRQELSKSAVEMIKINPLFGVGLNNFIPAFAKLSSYSRSNAFFQPVHNTYILILVETGIVGFAGFSYFLFKVYKKLLNKPLYLIMFGQMIILLFFDHYFYTLWQTQLLFTILIGLMLKKDSYENA